MTFINKQNTPTLDDLKKSKLYSYDSSNRLVTINDSNFQTIVSVYNETINKVLYVLGDEDKNGTINNNTLVYSNTVSGVSDSDILVILFKANDTESNSDIVKQLELLIVGTKITNKILSDSYAAVLPKEEDLEN